MASTAAALRAVQSPAPSPRLVAERRALTNDLKARFPRDVLMPCKPGTKQPMMRHKDGKWTWAKWEAGYATSWGDSDVAIVLQELCIIDVDSVEQAVKLEARFPCLKTVPCETTKRGMHYFFRRSALADEHGYYDGAQQREKGIDFKTVSRTGTGGIVLVAPSSGKAWKRSIVGAELCDIPQELLEAVAIAKHATVDARLRFGRNEAELVVRSCPWLHAMRYFEPLLAGRWNVSAATVAATAAAAAADAPPSVPSSPTAAAGGGSGMTAPKTSERPTSPITTTSPLGHTEAEAALKTASPPLSPPTTTSTSSAAPAAAADIITAPPPTTSSSLGVTAGVVPDADLALLSVPCDRAIFVELLHLLNYKELAQPPTDEHVHEVCALADMLGCPPALWKCLLPTGFGRPREQMDLYNVSPTWWKEDMAEAVRRRSHKGSVASDESLVRIDASLSKTLVYEPLERDERWLFHNLNTTLPESAKGKPVLRPDPAAALRDRLPPAVLAILERHRDCIVLAGGAVTGAAAAHVPDGHDHDLFCYGIDAAAAEKLVNDIEHEHGAAFDLYFTPRAITLTSKASRVPGVVNVIFQVIFRLHANRAQVIESFDLAPCKALARIDTNGDLVIEALPSWCEALKTMSMWVDTSMWGAASVARILKYAAKGFEVFVPGLRRAAMKAKGKLQLIKMDASYSALFAAEAQVLSWREPNMYRRFQRSYLGVEETESSKERNAKRITPYEARTIARRLGPYADYELSHKLQGSLPYVVRSFVRNVKWLTRAARPIEPRPERVWLMFDGKKCGGGMAQPRDPATRDVYDFSKLEESLTAAEADTEGGAAAAEEAAEEEEEEGEEEARGE